MGLMISAILALAAMTPHQVTLAHSYKVGETLKYEFSVVTAHKITGSAVLAITILGPEENLTTARVELLDLTMEGVDLPKRTLTREYKLRPTGIPLDAKTNSVDELLVFAFAAMYLPAGPVELDEAVPLNWQSGKTSFLGYARIRREKSDYRVLTQGEFRPEGNPGYKVATSSVFTERSKLLRGSFKLISPEGEVTFVSLRP